MLGLKKRGFGEGKYNGFGGKLNKGESFEEAACREIEEECGLIPLKIEKKGEIHYTEI